jgi:ABC-type Na+ efflux pump permease subunit
MATTTAPRTENDTSHMRRSLLAGIIVWFVHFNLVYNLASLACTWSWFSFTIVGVSGIQLVETIITLITLPFMLFLIYVPWREWRRFQTQPPPANPRMLEDTEKDRRSLVAFIVMLLNGFFFLFVVAMFVPIFALGPCGQS